jgi:exopolyphosphatase/guanosine-5'-triphosphate,3'-diphosphate pyrophosphatase
MKEVQPVCRAVIDVGTNSVKLLVAEVVDGQVIPVLEKSDQTRLGHGFYETRRLLPETIAQTAGAVGTFARLAHTYGVERVRTIATSAARDASNQRELIDAIEVASGTKVEIISGEQEAEWVFRGVSTDPRLNGQRLLILDVGGGSTEFILGESEHHQFRQSFDVGSVRLFEKLKPGDPPGLQDLVNCRTWLREFFNGQIAPGLEHLLKGGPGQGGVRAEQPSSAAEAEEDRKGWTPNVQLVGTGGTTTILARIQHQLADFDRDKIEGARVTRAEVKEWMVQLWSLSLNDRQKIVGLPPKRADIIPMGVAIYEAVMEHFGFPDVYVSTRGLRFGAVMDPA